MAEELPDGTRQGYFNICKNCGKEIEVNMQGNPLNHKCMKKSILNDEKDGLYEPLYSEKDMMDFALLAFNTFSDRKIGMNPIRQMFFEEFKKKE